MIKLIALDRDGVINKNSPFYIRSPAEWYPLPGSLAAIAKLKQAGYKIVIVTNQSGIGRGYFTLATLNLIHQKMLLQIRAAGGDIDEIFMCPHAPDALCQCRKPQPGLLLQAAAKFKITPQEIVMIGDSLSDILAAKNCGAQAIFVTTKHNHQERQAVQTELVPIYADLAAAVASIHPACMDHKQ